MHRFLHIGVVACLIVWTVQAQPGNDNFTNRFLLTGASILTNGSNLGASSEPGESSCIRSTWWQWTAPSNGMVLIAGKRKYSDLRPSVYVGQTISNLQEAYCLPSSGSRVVVPVLAGTAYQIAVQTDLDAEDDYQLCLDFFEPPSNDNFTNRANLGSGSAEVAGYTVSASSEPGETWIDGPLQGQSPSTALEADSMFIPVQTLLS